MTQNAPPLKIIFAGTPDFSVAPLQTLLDSKHEVIAVYSQPDRPAGRGRKLTASPVKAKALEYDIPVYQPETLKAEATQAALKALEADIMIVVAYGLILPKPVLDAPKFGCLNIHASILPRWRGAAPIQRAIEMGDAETGVTIMQMDIGLDTGDMLSVLKTPITTEDTAQTLHDRLSQLGCKALMNTLKDLQAEKLQPQKQDEAKVTYAEKLSKAEAEINWQQSAEQIARKIQAYNPWPVAFSYYDNQPLRIWQATVHKPTLDDEKVPGLVLFIDKNGIEIATGQGSILVKQLQPSGKKPMAAYDFAQSRNLLNKMLGRSDGTTD